MKTKDFPDARVYYPDDEKEIKIIEGLVDRGLIDYIHGGYSLNKKGVDVCKELEKKKKREEQDHHGESNENV